MILQYFNFCIHFEIALMSDDGKHEIELTSQPDEQQAYVYTIVHSLVWFSLCASHFDTISHFVPLV